MAYTRREISAMISRATEAQMRELLRQIEDAAERRAATGDSYPATAVWSVHCLLHGRSTELWRQSGAFVQAVAQRLARLQGAATTERRT